jgi:hypothetical protein
MKGFDSLVLNNEANLKNNFARERIQLPQPYRQQLIKPRLQTQYRLNQAAQQQNNWGYNYSSLLKKVTDEDIHWQDHEDSSLSYYTTASLY